MEYNIMISGKKLTKSVVEKLDEILMKGNMEQLKKKMEKLFTFKNICNLYDDHITELAECITDLWMSDDKVKWVEGTEDYLRLRISRYNRHKQKCFEKVQWAKAAKNVDEVTMMDLKYRLWVYEHGFEFSHFQMYNMLYRITQTILHEEERRKHEN